MMKMLKNAKTVETVYTHSFSKEKKFLILLFSIIICIIMILAIGIYKNNTGRKEIADTLPPTIRGLDESEIESGCEYYDGDGKHYIKAISSDGIDVVAQFDYSSGTVKIFSSAGTQYLSIDYKLREFFNYCGISNIYSINFTNYIQAQNNALSPIGDLYNLLEIFNSKNARGRYLYLPARFYDVDTGQTYEANQALYINSNHLRREGLTLYSITYNLNGGIVEGNPTSYYSGDPRTNFTLKNPTRSGYIFQGWSGSYISNKSTSVTINGSTMSGDLTFTANWGNTDTRYTVNHWKQNINGNAGTHDTNNYTLADTEPKTGTIDTSVTPERKTYTGFTAPSAQTTTIAGEGNTVVNYYYTRNSYNVTVNPNGGRWENKTDNSTFSLIYEGTRGISNPERTGYTFNGWSVSGTGSSINGTTFTMGSEDATITASWSANTNTSYIVKHWKQKLNGNADIHDTNNYTLADTDNNTGTTDASITPGRKTYTGFTAPSAQTTTIAGAGNTVVNYYYTRNSYNVTVNPNGGRWENKTDNSTFSLIYEGTRGISNPERTGYTFNGWSVSGTGSSINGTTFTMGSEDATITASWSANTNTSYIVKHWKQKLNGNADIHDTNNYTLADTDNNTGTTDTSITPERKTYTGFTAPSAQTTTIAGEGNTVVNYYYTRNSYNVTVNPNGGRWENQTDNSTFSLIYEGTRGISNPERAGYTFNGWRVSGTGSSINGTTFTMGSEDTTVTANWTANTDTRYVVNHWKQNLNGNENIHDASNYTLEETENFTGTTDASITPERKTYTGFTAPSAQTTTIAGEGNTVVDYYYTRNSYKVNVKIVKGIAAVYGGGTYSYGQDVAINAVLAQGYTWVKWTGREETEEINHTFTMPASEVTYIPVVTPNTNTAYKVEHWKQKLGGIVSEYDEENYILEEVDECTGTTDKKVSPDTKIYVGYNSPNVEGIATTITGEGTTVIEYYYTRKCYDVILNKGKGIEEVKAIGKVTGEGASKYLYEEEMRIEAKVKPGYTWAGWTGEENIDTTSHTFRIGTKGVEYTANAIANTNTPYEVRHWKQNTDTERYTLEETENFTGTTDEQVTPTVKSYEGFISPEAETITIKGDGTLVVNYMYTRKADLSYTVNYLEKGTNKQLREPKTVNGQIYESEIIASNEIVNDIYGYKYDSTSTDKLKITLGENTLNIYYTKKDATVKVHHYIYDAKSEEYTTTKLVGDEEIIGKVGDEYTTGKSDRIPANYIVIDEEPEKNKGIMEEEIIEVSYYYKLKIPKLDSEIKNETSIDEKTGRKKYDITYNTTIKDYIGKATIIITAYLPEEIDIEKSDLGGGTYNEETRTITWREEIKDIDTYKNGNYSKEVNKEIIIQYKEQEEMDNFDIRVGGETILYYPDNYPEKGGEQFTEEELEKEKKAKVITHHYIYDAPQNEYTTIKLAEDEEKRVKIGDEYTTSKSSKVPENYIVIDEEPEKYKGIMVENDVEVSYYYKLKMPEVDSEMKYETSIDEETGRIKYDMTYSTTIKDFIGKATIIITAQLPEEIDIEKSDLGGGTYNEETRTITWREEIRDIDTYKNGNYSKEVNKEIIIQYKKQEEMDNFDIKVAGKTILYYPDNYPEKGGEPFTEEELEEKKDDAKVNFKVEKIWDDNSNAREKRPQSVTITIRVIQKNKEIDVKLNKDNNWTYEEKGLPKYDKITGEKIRYEIIEKETEEGDLRYYEEGKEGYRELQKGKITNIQYKVINTYKTEGPYRSGVITVKYMDIDTNEEITKDERNRDIWIQNKRSNRRQIRRRRKRNTKL